MNIPQVALRLMVSQQQARRIVSSGKIRSTKDAEGRYDVTEEAIIEYKNRPKQPTNRGHAWRQGYRIGRNQWRCERCGRYGRIDGPRKCEGCGKQMVLGYAVKVNGLWWCRGGESEDQSRAVAYCNYASAMGKRSDLLLHGHKAEEIVIVVFQVDIPKQKESCCE